MLDKNVEYAPIYMRRPKCFPVTEYALPNGFHYVTYKDGDEAFWEDIETSVLEFADLASARCHFDAYYLPHKDQLAKRLIFIENENGEKVATAMPWFSTFDGKRLPWLNWIAVKPEYQGFGLGKAVTSRALVFSRAFDGQQDIYIATQSWSHHAIYLYQKLGFVICGDNVPGIKNSDYMKGVTILRELGYNILVEH